MSDYPIIVSETSRTLRYSTKTHPASKRYFKAVMCFRKTPNFYIEIPNYGWHATAQAFKVNIIRCDLAWLPACNKEYHQQKYFGSLAGRLLVITSILSKFSCIALAKISTYSAPCNKKEKTDAYCRHCRQWFSELTRAKDFRNFSW